jgi:CheY-like chemotaxis protein
MNTNNAGMRAHVLLVEDESLIRECAADVLTEQGFAVKAVSDAADALSHLTAGLPVDVLFTDVNLPGDIDGEMLARRARELRPGLAVMYTSGRGSVIRQLDPVVGSMFVSKPYDLFHLGRLLDYLIGAARPPQRKSVALSGCRLRELGRDAATGEEFFQPVDVVGAVDDILLAHQRPEQGQRRLDPVDYEFVKRALESH